MIHQQDTQPCYVITDADRTRIAAIALAWKAYAGELDRPLSTIPGQADDNVMDNRCSPVVDGGVHFLFGKEVDISVSMADGHEGKHKKSLASPRQDVLDRVWGRKEARVPLLQDLAMNGAMAGRAFLRIKPVGDTFRLIVLDPSLVYVQTDPEDCETVRVYCIEYAVTEQQNGRPVTMMYREEITRNDPDHGGDAGHAGTDRDATWTVRHWSRVGERGAWTPLGTPIAWNYPFAPIFSNKNLPRPNDFWGKPDITPDVIGMNNSLNLVQSSLNRILKLYASPILYATGTGQQVIDLKPGRIHGLPLSESKIVAVTLVSDVANGLKFAETLRSDIDELTNIPAVATGRFTAIPRGDLSGTAIELIFMPALNKTETKRCLYGELMIDVSKALLVLAGLVQHVDDEEITLAWGNPLPHDDLPAAQTAVLLKQVDISNTTLQRNLGFDPEEEMALSQLEAQQKLEAAQKLGVPPPPLTPTPMSQAEAQGQPQPAQGVVA